MAKTNFVGYYNVLGPHDSTPFSWRNKAPLRMVFFVDSAALGKILTTNNLRKRHVILVDYVVCVRRLRSQWTIFYSIVKWLVHYGIPSFNLASLAWVMPEW